MSGSRGKASQVLLHGFSSLGQQVQGWVERYLQPHVKTYSLRGQTLVDFAASIVVENELAFVRSCCPFSVLMIAVLSRCIPGL